MTIRLVALDLDGTLLDPRGDLRDDVRAAVAMLRRAQLRVVVCTGRRYRTALPVLERLGLSGPVVIHNGALVKDIAEGKTLQHAYLPGSLYPDVLTLMRRHGPPLVYVDSYHEGVDLLTEGIARAHPYQREYLDDHGEHAREVGDLAAARHSEVIMLSTMADEDSLGRLSGWAEAELGARVRTHRLINKNYRGQILEFLSPQSGQVDGAGAAGGVGRHRALRDRRGRRRHQRRRDDRQRRARHRHGQRRGPRCAIISTSFGVVADRGDLARRDAPRRREPRRAPATCPSAATGTPGSGPGSSC